jgi:hypothetical protein
MEILAWCRFFCQDTWPLLEDDVHRMIDRPYSPDVLTVRQHEYQNCKVFATEMIDSMQPKGSVHDSRYRYWWWRICLLMHRINHVVRVLDGRSS